MPAPFPLPRRVRKAEAPAPRAASITLPPAGVAAAFDAGEMESLETNYLADVAEKLDV